MYTGSYSGDFYTKEQYEELPNAWELSTPPALVLSASSTPGME